jgi:hypothetical protein
MPAEPAGPVTFGPEAVARESISPRVLLLSSGSPSALAATLTRSRRVPAPGGRADLSRLYALTAR